MRWSEEVGSVLRKENDRGLLWRGSAFLPAIAWAGLIFFVSSQPKEAFVRLGLSGALFSFAGHLFSYAMLMVLSVIALRSGGQLSLRRSYLVAFLLVALYGLSDEFHQMFVPGRLASLEDWIVDLLGAGLAWLILAYWMRRAY